MLEATIKLADTLASKPSLNEDEMGTYSSLLAHIRMQMRLATFVIRRQAVEEGLTEDDIEGFTPAEHK
jgi:hypothetical protein